MTPTLVEMTGRYHFPSWEDPSRWVWRLHTEIVGVNVPTAPDESSSTHLPPTFFTYNAADLIRLNLSMRPSGSIYAQLIGNGQTWTVGTWARTGLWSQLPRWEMPSPLPWPGHDVRKKWPPETKFEYKPWSLRYRTVDAAGDILGQLWRSLERLQANATSPDKVRALAQEMRREITLDRLGRPGH